VARASVAVTMHQSTKGDTGASLYVRQPPDRTFRVDLSP
jgi:hypothetical protein